MTGTPMIRLRDIMATKLGSVTPQKTPNHTFDLYSIPAFDRGQSDLILGANIGSAKQIVQPGDVLLSKIVPHIRRSWVVDAAREHEQIASGEWIVFRSSAVDSDYLKHVLVSDLFHRKFMSTVAGVGGSLLRARPSHVAELSIPLPPLPEQRRIANMLDQVDQVTQQRNHRAALLRELQTSVFLSMFGEADRSWPMTTLEAVTARQDNSIRTGPFGSQLLASEFTASGVAVLGIDNAVHNKFTWGRRRYISEAKYRDLTRFSVRPRDLLVTIMGTCGRCAIVPDDVPKSISTKHLCCISLDEEIIQPQFVHSYFLMHPIARDYLASKAKGAIMSGLNMGIIKSLPIPIPPMHLQVEYLSLHKRVDEMMQKTSIEEDGLRELNTTLAEIFFG